MKKKSIKKNMLFVFLRQFLGTVFTLISFTYLSRVLGPTSLGKTNFAGSFASFFTIVAFLGIPLYGSREIAKIRGDRDKVNKITFELLTLTLISALLVFLVYMTVIFFNSKTNSDILLFVIVGIGMVLSVIKLEWLYIGHEDYIYLNTRALFFQLIFTIVLFFVVKSDKHYYYVPLILVLNSAVEVIMNYILAKQYIDFKIIKKYDIVKEFKNILFKHLKPTLLILAATVAAQVYMLLDSVMLGFFIEDEKYVGFYNVAIRINGMFITLLVTLGSTFAPRLANFYNNNMVEEGKEISKKWENILYMLSLPIMAGMFLFAKDIIDLIAGDKYNSSILTSKIMIPVLFFSIFTNFFGIQLYSRNKEKIVSIIIIIGASLAAILNAIFIPKFFQNGAAGTTVFIQGLIMLIHYYACKKDFGFEWNLKSFIKYLLATLGMVTILIFFRKINIEMENGTVKLMLRVLSGFSVGVISYFLILVLIKDNMIYSLFNRIKKKI